MPAPQSFDSSQANPRFSKGPTWVLAFLLLLHATTRAGGETQSPLPVAAGPPPAPTTTNQPRYPYSGLLAGFDTDRHVIALAGRKKPRFILLSSATRITRAGMPSGLETAEVGEEVAGLCVRDPRGQEVAITLRLGPKVEPPPTPPATLKPIRPPKVIEP